MRGSASAHYHTAKCIPSLFLLRHSLARSVISSDIAPEVLNATSDLALGEGCKPRSLTSTEPVEVAHIRQRELALFEGGFDHLHAEV